MPDSFKLKITKASKDMENPTKRATNPAFKSKYANLSDTLDVIEPVLEKYKLWHKVTFHGTNLVYTVYDLEQDEQVEFSSIDLGPLMTGLSGNVWQGMGQAVTYMRRYLSQAFWGLVPEDDDAQTAPTRQQSKSSAPARRKQQVKDEMEDEDDEL